MAAVYLDHLPRGVVILSERSANAGQPDARAWVEAVRRPTHRRLQRPVAEHLAEARDDGEA